MVVVAVQATRAALWAATHDEVIAAMTCVVAPVFAGAVVVAAMVVVIATDAAAVDVVLVRVVATVMWVVCSGCGGYGWSPLCLAPSSRG